jgi:hypothetical protein
VVIELPQRHPLAAMTPLWRHFWALERPAGPTASDALAVIREAGFPARLAEWEEDPGIRPRPAIPPSQEVEFLRIRLCLTSDRDPEIAQVMATLPTPPRRLATIWWDTAR